MALSDVLVKKTRPRTKPFKLNDGNGLYLYVSPSGGKLWRFDFSFFGRRKTLSLGSYPATGLSDARKCRDDAKTLISKKIDPCDSKRIEKQQLQALSENSFEVVARNWFKSGKFSILAESSKTKKKSQFERYVFPYIGNRPIAELSPIEILKVLQRIEKLNYLEVAHKTKNSIGQVFKWAILEGFAQTDPTRDLSGALRPALNVNLPSPAGEVNVCFKTGEYLRMFDGFTGTVIVGAAIKILPYLFCRTGELRLMKWTDLDLKNAEWRYTASKTKTDHLVPLSKQAIEILSDLIPLTGQCEYVFAGANSLKNPMSSAAINAAYRRLGIDTKTELTGHGWRSLARTLLHEKLKYHENAIERQLAHGTKAANGTAYDRAQFISERIVMMQDWADYLDKLKLGADVIPIRLTA